MPRPRAKRTMSYGEEKCFVAQLGDQPQLVLDQLPYFLRRAFPKTSCQSLFGQRAQPARRRLAGRHQLLRIFISQGIEREGASLRNRDAFGQQFLGIELRQPHAQPQAALGVRIQRMSALGERLAQAHRGEHVLQTAARSHMHVHVARGDQR